MFELSSTDLEFFCDQENWLYGPVLESVFIFAPERRPTNPIATLLNDEYVYGPFTFKDIPQVFAQRRLAPKKVGSAPDNLNAYGILFQPHKLKVAVGIHYFCMMEDEESDLFVGIPPRHAERACGEWPWWEHGKAGWVTPGILQLHEVLIALVARLRRNMDFRIVQIQDESWWLPTRDSDVGVAVYNGIAEAAGWEVSSRSSKMEVLPWSSIP